MLLVLIGVSQLSHELADYARCSVFVPNAVAAPALVPDPGRWLGPSRYLSAYPRCPLRVLLCMRAAHDACC